MTSRRRPGETFVDHRVFFCIQGKKNGLNHQSFEVQDIDDVMIGHNHLKAKGYADVGHRSPPDRQSHLRLLAEPLGPRALAMDRYRHAQRARHARPMRDRRSRRTVGRSHPALLPGPRISLMVPTSAALLGWPYFSGASAKHRAGRSCRRRTSLLSRHTSARVRPSAGPRTPARNG